MQTLYNLMYVTLKSAQRDRILHAMFGISLLLLLLVPAFSVFSMRQVQELAITLSLSSISLALLVVAVLLGASSIWRDIERRYTTSILGLPISRCYFLLGKFAGIASLLASFALILGVATYLVVGFCAELYPSGTPVNWVNVCVAICFDSLKYILLAAFAMLFSTLSTSFFLPIFGAISVYLAGSASQEVFEYLSGEYGKNLSPVFSVVVKGVYYLVPNFAGFNLKVQAIYGLPLSASGLAYTVAYFLVYTSLLLCISVWVFSRRELP